MQLRIIRSCIFCRYNAKAGAMIHSSWGLWLAWPADGKCPATILPSTTILAFLVGAAARPTRKRGCPATMLPSATILPFLVGAVARPARRRDGIYGNTYLPKH